MHSQPIDFHPPTKEAAPILLPVATTLFADRAGRFSNLAEGHSLGDWLRFLGKLSTAQQAAYDALPELPLPAAEALEQAITHGMPALDIANRPAAWRDALHQIARELLPEAPESARATLDELLRADDARLEQLAERLLGGDIEAADTAALPFVAAALQVVFTRLSSRLDAARLPTMDAHNVCPCCGSPAVASILRLGAEINNLRYLHCSLCNAEWNLTRALCAHCGGDKDLALHELAEAGKPVRAETCGQCKSALKIVYQERNPNVDPVADDLATLALDLLVDEVGFERAGVNLLLIGGNKAD